MGFQGCLVAQQKDFYVNKCGFKIDEFWCENFQPEHNMPAGEENDPDEGPDEMFHFIKVMKQ